MEIVYNAFVQSLTFLPLTLGLSISYGITKLTDLAVEGSFLFGAAIYAHMMFLTNNIMLSTIMGSLSGVLVGCLTASIQMRKRMNSLLAGVLTLFIMQSVNIYVMGKPNMSLLDIQSHSTLVIVGLNVAIGIGVFVLLKSVMGLKLRALGDNPGLFEELFNSRDRFKCVSLCVSNSLAALSGILTASSNGFVDIQMGQGLSLVAIGTVLIGTHLSFLPNILKFAASVFLYFLLSHVLIYLGFDTFMLRLIIAGVLILVLGRRYES